MQSVKFNRVAHYIALSSIGKNNEHPKSQMFYLGYQEVLITLEEYIKSQAHIDIVSTLFDRDINKYLEMYKYLDSNKSCNLKLLHEIRNYYYTDIAMALINNKTRMIICVDSRLSFDKEDAVELDYFKRHLEIQNIIYDKDLDSLISKLESCPFIEIFNSIDSIEEYENKWSNFAIASLLLDERNRKFTRPIKTEVQDEVKSTY